VIEFGPKKHIFGDNTLVQNDDVAFGQSSNGELTMERVTDFANDYDVQRQIQSVGNLGRDDDTAARQSQDDIGMDALMFEGIAEPSTRIFPRSEHALRSLADERKSIAEEKMTNDPIRKKSEVRNKSNGAVVSGYEVAFSGAADVVKQSRSRNKPLN